MFCNYYRTEWTQGQLCAQQVSEPGQIKGQDSWYLEAACMGKVWFALALPPAHVGGNSYTQRPKTAKVHNFLLKNFPDKLFCLSGFKWICYKHSRKHYSSHMKLVTSKQRILYFLAKGWFFSKPSRLTKQGLKSRLFKTSSTVLYAPRQLY